MSRGGMPNAEGDGMAGWRDGGCGGWRARRVTGEEPEMVRDGGQSKFHCFFMPLNRYPAPSSLLVIHYGFALHPLSLPVSARSMP